MYALRVFLAYKRAFADAATLPMLERHAARAAALDTMMRLVPMAQKCDKRIAWTPIDLAVKYDPMHDGYFGAVTTFPQ